MKTVSFLPPALGALCTVAALLLLLHSVTARRPTTSGFLVHVTKPSHFQQQALFSPLSSPTTTPAPHATQTVRRRREQHPSFLLWAAAKKAGGAGSSSSSSSGDKQKKKPSSSKNKIPDKEEDLEAFLTSLELEGQEEGGDVDVGVATEGEGDNNANEEIDDDLSEDMRALLAKPTRRLDQILKEAGIEFGDPTLMEDDDGPTGFRAGFVTIVGSPNVGKSTLMNSLVGERVSIVTSKQQTTRHQIMGVVSGEDFQIVYYDTPGVLRPYYKLQEGMMAFVKESLGDADVVLMMTDVFENPEEFPDQDIFQQLEQCKRPLLLAVNKVDVLPNATHPQGKLGKDALEKVGTLEEVLGRWRTALPNAEIIPISAQEKENLDELLVKIKGGLPLSPPLYPNDTLTDKPQRFFASEMIREKIFLSYSKEIPYSCEVAVTAFKDTPKLLRINSTIFTTRDSHVPILIGTKGSKLKEVGSLARLDLEAFFGKKVFLEIRVKVKKDWRANIKDLNAFGYMQE